MRYIDADELLELYDIDLDGLETDKPWTIPLEVVKQNIKDMPSADVEPIRHGHWKTVFDKIESNLSDIGYFKALPKFICSECGNEMIASTQYCPNCGARMDGEERKPFMINKECYLEPTVDKNGIPCMAIRKLKEEK